MNRLTRWLASRLISEEESLRDPDVRSRLGVLEGWVSVFVNLILAAIKLVLGIMLQSAGLISDAVHSLSDLGTSLVVIVGFHISKKPADPEHPFGHEKSEHVATLIISVLLVIAGVEIGKETVLILIGQSGGGEDIHLTWGMSGVLVLLMVAKELLAAFSVSLGKIIDSKALIADGWHHRTDAITTGMVILGLAGRNIGLPWLDGLAGLLVALFIVYTGIKMAYQAVSPLLGETAEKGEIEKIKEIGRQVAGVESVHDIRVQRYGNFNIISIHAELSDRLSPRRMHEITVQIETRILRKFPGECVVHTDPVDLHHPLFNEVTDTMREVVIAHPDLLDFHDLKLWDENGAERGDVEVTVDHQVPNEAYQQMSSYIMREINRCFPELKFKVFLKVDFSSTPINDNS